MPERTSHIGAVVELMDKLPTKDPAIGGGTALVTLASVATTLKIDLHSISFGKCLLWINAFVLDGDDVLKRSTLKEQDKIAALGSYRSLTNPFRYPFSGENHDQFQKKTLTPERRSFFSLLDQFLQKEHPIYVPSVSEIDDLIRQLHDIIAEFKNLSIAEYIKQDFEDQLNLYIVIATELPMVAHRLLANESKTLISWLLSTLPDDAKRTVSKAAIVINVLVAAFVAPAEASDAATSYYKWFSEVSPQPKLIETTVAPKALPAPRKVPLEQPTDPAGL